MIHAPRWGTLIASTTHVAALVGFLADRVGELGDLEGTRFLQVRLDRLRRWHRPGALLIGDAAHAMYPIGGVVNLAIKDAVATANILTGYLLRAQRGGGPVPRSALAAVQRRRRLPAVATRAFQRLAQRFGIDRALLGGAIPDLGRIAASRLVRWAAGRLVGVGLRPEHVRAFGPIGAGR